MSDPAWVAVAKEDDVPENSARLVFPRGLGILVIRKAGKEFYAVSNKCAHMACPMGVKAVDGYLVRCPCHDWSFDIRTGGLRESPEIKIPVYEWKFTDGKLYINLGGRA
jgi:3-phenylpropionate/trans-cinnamate dioxygenase ferredoxin subunit